MRFVFSFLLLILLLAACTNGPGDSPARGLRVSDPDHLYFKNVRVNLYASADDHELNLTKYTHRKFMDADSPIQLVLVDNWIHGLAYLEMKRGTEVLTGTVLQISNDAGLQTTYEVKELANRATLTTLKRELTGKAMICYPGTGEADEYCFPAGSPAREALRETIFDFLRLTELEG